MGFFSSIGQVASNKKNFKRWEKDSADKQEQRNVLTQKKPPTAEQLVYAKKQGEVIMDVVDIMDAHSEDVAENIETSVMPVAQMLPLLSTFGITALLGKFLVVPATEQHDKAVKTFLNSEDGKLTQKIVDGLRGHVENLKKEGKEFTHLKKLIPGQLRGINSFISKTNLKKLSKVDDIEVKKVFEQTKQLSEKFNNIPEIKGLSKKLGMAGGIIAAVSIGLYVASNLVAAKLQVGGSRVARWQSRQDLKDPKYFVQYTDSQIETAKKSVAENQKPEKKGLFANFGKDGEGRKKGMIASIKSVLDDKKAYSEWKKNNKDDARITRELTPQEILEAQKDKEVIQRVTKIINNKAEDYSENMETTAAVLIGGTPFLGAGIGAILNLVLNKTGISEKSSQHAFEKLIKNFDETDTTALKSAFKEIKPGAKTELGKTLVYVKKMFDATEKTATKSASSIVQSLNIANRLKKIAMTTKYGRNVIVAVAGAFITGLAGALIGLKLQKASARAGRFNAKRELEQKPENFIGYSEEDFKEVNGVKADKIPLSTKFKEYITFLPRVIKQYVEYQKYRKTEAKDEKQIKDALIKLDVSNKQLEDAKNLQRKMYATFEKVDDKSQEYSESVEAVNEMVAPFIPYAAWLAVSSPLVVLGIMVAKGKVNVSTIVEKATSFIKKKSKFLKGKTADKYFTNVAENVSKQVKKQTVSGQNNASKVIADILPNELPSVKNMSVALNNFVSEIGKIKGKEDGLTELLKLVRGNKVFAKLTKEEAISAIDSLDVAKLLNKIDLKDLKIDLDTDAAGLTTKIHELTVEMKKIIQNYCEDGKTLSSINLDKMVKDGVIPALKIDPMIDALENFAKVKGAAGKASKDNILNKFVDKDVAVDFISATLNRKIKNGDWRKYLKTLEENIPNPQIASILSSLRNSKMTDAQALKICENLTTIGKNIPKEQLEKIINVVYKEFKENPEAVVKMLKKGDIKKIFVTKGVVEIAGIATGTWTALGLVLTYGLESLFAKTQKEAGRLGVMKALEELDDPAYYANTEPKNATPSKVNTNVPGTINASQLMQNFIKK